MPTKITPPATPEASFGNTLPQVPDPTPPRRIIYREIDIVLKEGGYPINIVYLPRVLTDPKEDELDDFIATVINRKTSRGPGAAPITSPLDLNCYENCFIMFRLADDWNWQFLPEGNSFTTKEGEGDKYFNLGHAKYDATAKQIYKYDPGEAPGEGCRLLFFRANGIRTGYNDGFNLAIELNLGLDQNGDKRRTKLVIDPDIRYPGGSQDP